METGSWDDDGVELMFDNDGCGMPRYYVGDPMHHEFHFVYSASHPFVFDTGASYNLMKKSSVVSARKLP
jgi:hypothetical protein